MILISLLVNLVKLFKPVITLELRIDKKRPSFTMHSKDSILYRHLVTWEPIYIPFSHLNIAWDNLD